MIRRPLYRPIALIALGLCLAAASLGCTAARPQPVSATASTQPYMLHLPGIGGERAPDHWLVDGLADGGVTAQIEIYDWTENDPGIDALQSYQRNHAEAKLIADKITAHYRSEPQRPIYLTCHSGGAGLAVWALEDLPDDVYVQKVVMLAPALSPKYDLTKALRHVRGYVYSFNSTLDSLILRTGTGWLGTIDGVRGAAAGYGGFVAPAGSDPQQYAKLIQYAYESDWAKYGNIGNHIGPMSEGFARAILAPLLLGHNPLRAEVIPATRPAAS